MSDRVASRRPRPVMIRTSVEVRRVNESCTIKGQAGRTGCLLAHGGEVNKQARGSAYHGEGGTTSSLSAPAAAIEETPLRKRRTRARERRVTARTAATTATPSDYAVLRTATHPDGQRDMPLLYSTTKRRASGASRYISGRTKKSRVKVVVFVARMDRASLRTLKRCV